MSSVEFRSNRSNLVQIGWPSRFISTDLASAPGSGEFPSCVSLSVSEVDHLYAASRLHISCANGRMTRPQEQKKLQNCCTSQERSGAMKSIQT